MRRLPDYGAGPVADSHMFCKERSSYSMSAVSPRQGVRTPQSATAGANQQYAGPEPATGPHVQTGGQRKWRFTYMHPIHSSDTFLVT